MQWIRSASFIHIRGIIRQARVDGSCGINVLYLPTEHNEGSSERPLLGHNFSRHTARQLLQGGASETFGGGKGVEIFKSPFPPRVLVPSLILCPFLPLPPALCTSSYCRTNIASRWIANKPGFGWRDLHHRRYERKREKERHCTLTRCKLHACVFTIRSDNHCVCTCVTYVCTRLCGVRCEKVLRSRYLFFGSIEPPVMIIGAM